MPFLLSLFGGATSAASSSGNAFDTAVANLQAEQAAAAKDTTVAWAVGIAAALGAVGLAVYFITRD